MGDISRLEKNREEFKDILKSLAQSGVEQGDTSKNIVARLESLYHKECFRHFYSDVFDVVSQIHGQIIQGDINVLAMNIDMIRREYKAHDSVNISMQLDKLYDHLNLEIGRLACFSTAKETGERLSKVDGLVRDLNEKSEETRKTLKKQQVEYIAILGIFASIVLAFTGGMAFSTSVLNNIAAANAYRVIVITLIVGLVFCDVVFGLFYFLGHLIKERASIFPFIISNIVIIVLLIVSLIAWNWGWIEKRDTRMDVELGRGTSQEVAAEYDGSR